MGRELRQGGREGRDPELERGQRKKLWKKTTAGGSRGQVGKLGLYTMEHKK